ncbi:MAG: SURF1 family protein [Nocardioides sp.]
MPSDVSPVPASRALAPRYWAAHLLMVVAVVACALLGRWQLGVWHGHRADNSASVTRDDPVALDDVLGRDAAFPPSGVGRPVVVQGRWDPAHTLYVANREQDGRTGLWAVTPVVTANGSAVPVVRGWTPSVAEAPQAPSGPASFVGLLQPSEETATTDQNTHDDVIPSLDVTDLLPRMPYDLYSGYVVATARDVPGGGTTSTGMSGLVAVGAEHLPGASASTALRNLLYAFQWWVFGAFAAFVWWRWLQEDVLGRRPSRRSPAPR